MPSGLQTKRSTKKQTRVITPDDLVIHPSCGNVFEDLGLPDPDIALAKADLIRAIRKAMAARKLSEAKAAELLKIDGKKFLELLNGPRLNFTIDRLMRMLNKLGQRVELKICVRDASPE